MALPGPHRSHRTLPFSQSVQISPSLPVFLPVQQIPISNSGAMVSTYGELISEQRFIWVSGSMIILASIFVLARIGIQIWRRKKMYLQDCLVYCAYTLFLTMSICYLIIVPNIYRIGRVTVGRIEPWPAFAEDVIVYVRLMFVTTSLFWLSLWFVKLSLLALTRT